MEKWPLRRNQNQMFKNMRRHLGNDNRTHVKLTVRKSGQFAEGQVVCAGLSSEEGRTEESVRLDRDVRVLQIRWSGRTLQDRVRQSNETAVFAEPLGSVV